MLKDFYNKHKNFSFRTSSEYYISPGIRCKFDLLKKNINTNKKFLHGIDLGSSGNSFLAFLDNIEYKSYYDIANLPLKQYTKERKGYPLCGDLIKLPYKDESFDFISALDVLEHIKNDTLAASEISRILKKKGLLILTVPHRMKFYSNQDKLIGHYRRYEIPQMKSLFKTSKLKLLKIFGVYGRLMRISDIQSADPKKIEETIISLRKRYETSTLFRKFWDIFVKVTSRLMKLDAKYHSLKNIMNIAFIFKKV
ncbi:MAG: class I SAM-dependent methyltransferase [Promethearchaeota archaeon]